jgi:hypothetical protein
LVHLREDEEGVGDTDGALEQAAAGWDRGGREVGDQASEGGFELPVRICATVNEWVNALQSRRRATIPLLANGASFLKYRGGILDRVPPVFFSSRCWNWITARKSDSSFVEEVMALRMRCQVSCS